MKKTGVKGIKIFLGLIAVCFFAWEPADSQSIDILLFPRDNFTVETKTVKTPEGEKKVTYHSYMHVPYVANPVDKDFQSLNVAVPVKVNEIAIDATNAPILFVIGVGGYMSVNNARTGSGNSQGGGMVQLPMGGNMGGTPGGSQGRAVSGPGDAPGSGPGGNSSVSGRADLALAAGYVVVTPGCRGRDSKAADGTFYGKAPAAIVDLKAAVRYIRHNQGVMPGNVNRIISTGVSAGGALSALLGSSGNSHLYDFYLKEIGAAEAADNIYGSACFCPITDLEHADGAYEWMYGTTSARSGLVEQELSKQLKNVYNGYQAFLNLQGKNGFGSITAENYDKYLLQFYLIPSANKFLQSLPDEKRNAYLANNKWITWTERGATFAFPDYVNHVGRMKGLPAFDDFAMRQPEPNLFGNQTTDARHFTSFSLQQATGNKTAEIDNDLKMVVNLMNAMYFINQNNSDCAPYWWIRHGTSDNHTSQTVIINLATSLENRNKNVNTWLYWDAGHGADEDPEDFITWIGKVSGFSEPSKTGK
jgi:hypothetical protein